MANHTPLVSVLVTAYNREAYLKDTLLSILQSTYEDFEVIVVDDNSSDNSLEIANQLAKQDSRIKAHSNKANLGDYPNRMKAASLAQGHYIKYVDSDDLIYPHSLAVMVDSMEMYPGAALGLSHSMPQYEAPYPWYHSPEETFRKHFRGRGCLSCGPSSAIIRRGPFESLGGFRPRWKVISDTDLWRRLASRWPTVLLPPALSWWRRHEGQEFTKANNDVVYLQRGFELSLKMLTNEECPLPANERAAALARSKQHFARRLLSMAFRNQQVRLALNLFRNSDLKISELVKGFKPYQ